MKGGYLIINLQGNAITANTSFTVNGIYNRLEGNYGKAILLTNYIRDGIEQPDVFASCHIENTGIRLLFGSSTVLTVSANDTVAVT